MIIPRPLRRTAAPGLALLLLGLAAEGARGDEDYPPGTFQLTPTVDLGLQPVPVHVPDRFSGIPTCCVQ